MIERHPAGRSCAVTLLAGVGLMVATAFGVLHAVAPGSPAQPASTPAGLMQTLAPTTTPAVTTTPAATTTAPVAAPRAAVAAPTTTEETTVANPPTTPQYIDLGSGVTQRVAPPAPAPRPPVPGPGDDGWTPPGGGEQAQPSTGAPDPGN